MSRSIDDISSLMRDYLEAEDPQLSSEEGSVTRKIIDVVAEMIYEAESQASVTSSVFDWTSKCGVDLDQFVELFQITRQAATSATGVVTFYRDLVTEDAYDIPLGTLVYKPASGSTPDIYFRTTSYSTLDVNEAQVDVPVQAVVAGTSGNVPSNSILDISSTITGVTSVTNTDAMSGGVDTEDDATLKARFKNSVFRNLAGTSDYYTAYCLTHQNVSRVLVLGPESRSSELLQLKGGSATSLLSGSKYTWPNSCILSNGETGEDELFYLLGTDYQFTGDGTVPAVITVLNSQNLPDGTIVQLEFTHCSNSSRNTPLTGKLNCVDVFVDGRSPQSVVETRAKGTSIFTETITDDMYRGGWLRDDGTTVPASGNSFCRLGNQPVMTIPDSIQILVGSVLHTFNKDVDYWLVYDQTTLARSQRGSDGIEWDASVQSTIFGSSQYSLQYVYDAVPGLLTYVLEKVRPLGSDLLVHSAKDRYFQVNLTVMLNAGYSSSVVQTRIEEELSTFIDTLPFGSTIQVQDLLNLAQVEGVDNVRLTTSADNPTTYGICEIAEDGVSTIAVNVSDFEIEDDEIASLHSVNLILKSQNTW